MRNQDSTLRVGDAWIYKVHDFDDHMYQFPEEWLDILKYGSKKEVLRKMYENVDAVCDMPAAFYWQELLEAFPDAKVGFHIDSHDHCIHEAHHFADTCMLTNNKGLEPIWFATATWPDELRRTCNTRAEILFKRKL